MPKPKPFSRPSVAIGGVSRKEWRERFALEATVGDMWAGHGLIYAVGGEHGSVLIWAGERTEPWQLEPKRRVMLFCKVSD